MSMAPGHFRRSRRVNNGGHAQRHRKTPKKGMGYYAQQPPGSGPRGLHLPYAKVCLCGGCSAGFVRAA